MYRVDPEGIATEASCKVTGCLARGDIREAMQHAICAAQQFEREIPLASSRRDSNFLKFLAATQYYRGGHYALARNLASEIKSKYLDGRSQELLLPFLQDVRYRASEQYRIDVKRQIAEAWNSDWKKVLEVLAEHPFVLPTELTMILRAVCFEKLDKDKFANTFHQKFIEMLT